MTKKKIYVAGPDVFDPHAIEKGACLSRLCNEFGFLGLYPLDHQAPEHLSRRSRAQWIFDQNIQLIREADIVMANLNFFRGAEPDSGTAFEIGFASALGKKIYAYLDGEGDLHTRMKAQAPEYVGINGRDRNGAEIEQFSYPVNLMLGCSARIIVGTARECLEQIRADFRSAGAVA